MDYFGRAPPYWLYMYIENTFIPKKFFLSKEILFIWEFTFLKSQEGERMGKTEIGQEGRAEFFILTYNSTLIVIV